MILSALLQGAGFLLIAFAEAEWHAILGVIATSLSLGLGEVTFLAHSSQFNRYVIYLFADYKFRFGLFDN